MVVLRRTRPDLPRSFRTPLVPLVPVLAVLSCWMLIGIVLYSAYGRSHLRMAAGRDVHSLTGI